MNIVYCLFTMMIFSKITHWLLHAKKLQQLKNVTLKKKIYFDLIVFIKGNEWKRTSDSESSFFQK